MSTMSSAAPESAIGRTSLTSRTTVRSGRMTWIVGGATSGERLAPGKSAGVSPTLAAALSPTPGDAAGAREVGRRVADLAGRVERDAGRAAGAREVGRRVADLRGRLADAEEPGSPSADAALTATSGDERDEPDREPADETAVGLHDDLLWMG